MSEERSSRARAKPHEARPIDGKPQEAGLARGNAREVRLVGGKASEVRLIGGKPHEVRLIGGKAHEVRLIGGLWKRSKLAVPDKPGLRPTPDRVRETLFNWLGQDLSGWRCLDAFGGSGALGFEAASRGAAQVCIVERDAQLVRALRAVKERLGAQAVRIEAGDGLAALRRAPPMSLDLVFLDPPYDSGLMAAALEAAQRCLVPGGFVYAEARQRITEWPARLQPHRAGRAGQVHFALLRAAAPTAAGDARAAATLPAQRPAEEDAP